jgi:phosphopantothenoylcysteine decarboxylase/phosphopantothenate--cysteine ligase
LVEVKTAQEMFNITVSRFAEVDLAFFSAAVADFRPAEIQSQKWKKEADGNMPPISFLQNPDILKHCGANKTKDQIVIGFALESQDEMENAVKKLTSKNADWMVLNSLKDEGAGFGGDYNKVTMIHSSGQVHPLPLMPKAILAQEILKFLLP